MGDDRNITDHPSLHSSITVPTQCCMHQSVHGLCPTLIYPARHCDLWSSRSQVQPKEALPAHCGAQLSSHSSMPRLTSELTRTPSTDPWS